MRDTGDSPASQTTRMAPTRSANGLRRTPSRRAGLVRPDRRGRQETKEETERPRTVAPFCIYGYSDKSRLSDLTPKQQLFVNAYLVEPNATKAAIAAGYSEKTARVQGSRLLTNADIVQAVLAKQIRVADKAELTLESHIETLATLRDGAIAANQHSAAITAEVSRGKAAGLYVERHQHTVTYTKEEAARVAHELLTEAVGHVERAD